MFNTKIQYIFCVSIFLFFAMFIWSFLLANKLYYCSDRVPFLDFIPPFVHDLSKNVPTDGKFIGTNDYYIKPKEIVFLVWFLLIIGSFFLPYFIVYRKEKKNAKY